MTDLEQEKVRRFVNDPVASKAVFDLLLHSFLSDRASQDVHTLAASRLAIDYLKQGWKELEKIKDKVQTEKSASQNIGL